MREKYKRRRIRERETRRVKKKGREEKRVIRRNEEGKEKSEREKEMKIEKERGEKRVQQVEEPRGWSEVAPPSFRPQKRIGR